MPTGTLCRARGEADERKAFLARSHKVETLKPLMQCDMAPLHNGFHGDSEILATSLLAAPIYAIALSLISVSDNAAMRTNWTIWPQNALKELAGRFVIAEMRG